MTTEHHHREQRAHEELSAVLDRLVAESFDVGRAAPLDAVLAEIDKLLADEGVRSYLAVAEQTQLARGYADALEWVGDGTNPPGDSEMRSWAINESEDRRGSLESAERAARNHRDDRGLRPKVYRLRRLQQLRKLLLGKRPAPTGK